MMLNPLTATTYRLDIFKKGPRVNLSGVEAALVMLPEWYQIARVYTAEMRMDL